MSALPSLFRSELSAVLSALRRRPFVPLLAVAMLTLGIGANVAVFTVISRTLLRPLRYSDPERLLAIYTRHVQPDRTEVDEPSNDLEFVQWKTRSTLFADMQAIKTFGMTISGSGDPESVDGARVSGGIFRLFGVRPFAGRDFTREDDVPDSGSVVVSYGLWQRRFGGSFDAFSRPVLIDGRPYRIVGVMPRGFEIPLNPADVYIPEGLGPSHMPNHRSWVYSVFGRLRDGVTPEQARAEIRSITRQLEREYPDTEFRKTATVKSLREAMVGDRRNGFLVLWLAVALVQVLACVNVANLMLARTNDQRGVTALRLVLGARQWQITRLRLLEGLLVTVAGGVAGYGLSAAAVHFLADAQPELTTRVESGWTILLFVLATIALTAVVISAGPALKDSSTSISGILNEGSRRTSSSVRGTRARELFVIVQVALAVPLLLSAISAVQRFRDLQRVDPGFDPDHVLSSQMIMPPRYDNAARTAFARELLRRIEEIPGVVEADVTTNLWNRGQTSGTFASTERFPEFVAMSLRRITPDYFRTMRIALVRGRAFTAQDATGSPPVAIVNEALEKRFWPGESALGKRIRRSPPQPWMTIVGVARDVHDEGIGKEAAPALYLPWFQNNGIFVSLVIRTKGEPLEVRDAVRRAVWSLDTNITPSAEKPLRTLVDATVDPERLQAMLLSSFAAVAFLLAILGIYAVTSYSVSQRTREIGVRLAFGATTGSIALEVLRSTTRCVAIGLGSGLALAFLANRIQLFVAYGASAFDAPLALGVCAVLFVTSLAAGFVPSLRTRYVTPMLLLRDA